MPLKKGLMEEQVSSNPLPLLIFLYAIVPILTLVGIYCALTGKTLNTYFVSVFLLSYMLVLIVISRPAHNRAKAKVYRYVFRTQLALLGMYLAYTIGFKGQFTLCPWIYVFVFFCLLLFRPINGIVVSFVFLGTVFLLSFINYAPEALPPNDVIIPFMFSLATMCFILYSILLLFEKYIESLHLTQSELQKSEQQYREQSLELQKEIKQRDKIEAQLHSAIKMETVGKLASGVAHDLNNILSGIVSYPDLLLLDLPEDSPLRGPIETIQKSGQRAASIVQDLLTLARRNVDTTKIIDLRQVVDDYLASPEFNNMVSYQPDIKIKTEFCSNKCNIRGSFVHLSKIIMNIISNAVEAMPSGGEIYLGLEALRIAGPDPAHPDIADGDYAVLTFRDTGIGIHEDDLAHIFEPFYTKKVMGRSGTGLGMAVVWGTVKDHNGQIEVSSIVDQGTTIKLFFPVVADEVEAHEPDVLISDIMGNNEKILVVDDIQYQRDLATGILKRLGYRAEECESGEKALEYLKKNDVDLVLMDMIMSPGIDGLETYKRITAVKPTQKAIFVSGFSNPASVKSAQHLGAGVFLRKPYSLVNLGKAVKEELEK